MRSDKNFLVIGDEILDVFHYGTVLGVSAETPTLVMRKDSTKTFSGGAGLVRRHLLSHTSGKARLVTRTGVKKERFIVDGHKLLQVDELPSGAFFDDHSDLEFLKADIAESDVVIISDNRHGTIGTYGVASWIVEECSRASKPLFVDSQVSQSDSNHSWYFGCSVMCMNEREFYAVLEDSDLEAIEIDRRDPEFEKLLYMVSSDWGCDIVIKLGDRGSVACVDGIVYWTDALDVNVVDTTGAGDAFLAALATGDLRGKTEQTLRDANIFAGLSCQRPGTELPDEIS